MAEENNNNNQNDENNQNDGNKEEKKEENENKPLTQLEQILATREQWEGVKKSLDAVMPIIDQVIRLEAVGNKPNKLKNTKKKKTKQIKDFTKKLENMNLPNEDPLKTEGIEIIQEISKDLNAEEMANKVVGIRRYTQKIVKLRRELMEEYKKLKKEQESAS